MHAIARSILPGDIVFDIGANAGDKAAPFLELGATVVCVEPQPAMVQVLRERFGDNPQVHVVAKGVARIAGRLQMSINTAWPAVSTFSPHWKTGRFAEQVWDATAEIEVTTFDALITEFGRPRFAKIDVEGFETEVLSGLTARAGAVSFEFTGEFLVDACDALCHLSSIDYARFNLSFADLENFAFDSWVDRRTLLATLFAKAREDADVWGDIYAV